MNQEIWKDIKGYEGFYKVSNLGRIMGLGREVRNTKYGSVRYIPESILKRKGTNSSGYTNIILRKNNKNKSFYVHRIVAENFLNPIDGKKIINHKNGIKTDNRLINLEWCTEKENIQHSIKTGLSKLKTNCKEVIDMSTGEKYESVKFAALDLGIVVSTLTHRLSGRLKNNTNLRYVVPLQKKW